MKYLYHTLTKDKDQIVIAQFPRMIVPLELIEVSSVLLDQSKATLTKIHIWKSHKSKTRFSNKFKSIENKTSFPCLDFHNPDQNSP